MISADLKYTGLTVKWSGLLYIPSPDESEEVARRWLRNAINEPPLFGLHSAVRLFASEFLATKSQQV